MTGNRLPVEVTGQEVVLYELQDEGRIINPTEGLGKIFIM